MRNAARELVLISVVLGEKAGGKASDLLDSDRAATYLLVVAWLMVGLLVGYAVAKILL